MREICIHGHFYQPTRVHPWTDRVEPQPSAGPFWDWNHRIAAESYAPNAAARLLDEQGRTRTVRNTYASMNFDFGPTLLSWLALERPVLLEGLRSADRDSISRLWTVPWQLLGLCPQYFAAACVKSGGIRCEIRWQACEIRKIR